MASAVLDAQMDRWRRPDAAIGLVHLEGQCLVDLGQPVSVSRRLIVDCLERWHAFGWRPRELGN
jgi:hypothetical protein